MAEFFVGPVMEKLINTCFDYFKNQLKYQTRMKDELQKLRIIHPQIKSVVSAYTQLEIQDPSLQEWLWQLRDAIEDAEDLLDEFHICNLEQKVNPKRKINKVRSLMKPLKKKLVKITKRALKIDPELKKLEESVSNLCKISDGVTNFLHLLRKEEQQQVEIREMRQRGSLPQNNLLGRREEIEFVRNWLRDSDPTENFENCNDFYRNVSVLSVVGHGGMGKTTLLQHVYSDEMIGGFDVKMWACVSTNFKAKTVILDLLKSLKIQVCEEPIEAVQRRIQSFKQVSVCEPLEELQSCLKSEVMSKRFLLVLDDIWEEDEGKWDEVNWENVLSPLRYGNSGSKIMISTRQDSVASMFAKMIKKSKKTLTLTGLEEYECLQLLKAHAFAGVENPGDEFTSIAEKMVEKLSGSPLAAKVIGKILNSYMDESYWRNVLNTNIGQVEQGQNHLIPILKLSYIYLPKFLKNCFAFCCMFPQDHQFDKDDLVRMWVSLGFIHSSDVQGETPESRGGKYFNILVQKSFFEKFGSDDKVYYKMHDLLHELAEFVSKQECLRVVDEKQLSLCPKTIRHLSITTQHLKGTFKDIGKFKNLRSLFLFGGEENLISDVLKASKNIRLLVFDSHAFNYNLDETIGCLIHLRYLKVEYGWSFQLPRSISYLHHLQFIISRSLQKLEMDNNTWKVFNTGRQELKINKNCQLITDEIVINDPSVLPIEPLRSISSLRSLRIEKNNFLVSFSSETEKWFLQYRSSLIELGFEMLKSLLSLPSSLESLSSLKILRLHNVPRLKLLPNLPNSLQELLLYKLKSLQYLSSSLSTISSLTILVLENIPLLESLPYLPSSLINLYLRKLKSLQCLPSSLSTISSLNALELKKIPLLESLPELPHSLLSLYLEKLEKLDRLPSCLPTLLNELQIIDVPQLLKLPDLPSSLEYLKIEYCRPQLMEHYEIFKRQKN